MLSAGFDGPKLDPDEAAAFFRTIPLGRIGRLEEDIGRAVVALCGPEMGYLTGATEVSGWQAAAAAVIGGGAKWRCGTHSCVLCRTQLSKSARPSD